jgi:hypothetical protein
MVSSAIVMISPNSLFRTIAEDLFTPGLAAIQRL